jgi:hypothetical protein
MRGLRRAFQTSAAALSGCELTRLEEALGVTIPNDPDKRKLDPTILFPDKFVDSAPPSLLCFPVITGEQESRLETISPADAMMWLLKMCPWSSYDTSAAPDHLRVLGRLVRQCGTFKLLAGRDIFDNPTGASQLLSAYV